MQFYNLNHIHCIGIGGIGMSALAIILKERGFTVSGSDGNLEQKSITQLRDLGCIIHNENEAIALEPTVSLVVYSAAVPHDHPELQQATALQLKVVSRAQLLAYLFNQQEGIAIAGAHGKTTTSSLIAHIFMYAQQDPTFAIGGHLHNYHTNARAGSGRWFIAETCENDHTITMVKPVITILTNVDREHLDIYNDLDDIKDAFSCYLKNTRPNGTLILCHEDANTMSLVDRLSDEQKHNIISYGFCKEADIFISSYELYADYSLATVYRSYKHADPELLGTFQLAIPGKHNLLNALAALIAAQTAGIQFENFVQACATFKGIDRRFTFKGLYKDAEIFDDYGHHPAEIEQIIPVAQKRAQHIQGRLIIIFQPHRYSRTQKLWDEFIKVFIDANFHTLIISDIYPAFEQPIESISSQKLTEALINMAPEKNILYIPEDPSFSGVQQTLDILIQPSDLVFFLGAGKINKLADVLTQKQM